jgi:hypothetical protein
MTELDTDVSTGVRTVVVPTDNLHGWPVRTEDGQLLGHVRDVRTNGEGQIATLDVRERWILGPHHTVPAGGMRIEHGEVVVPRSAADTMLERELEWQPSQEVPAEGAQRVQPLPVWIRGRERAARRFGGVDVLGSMLGALVSIAVIVLVGGVLRAGLETGPLVIDTADSSWDAVSGDSQVATLLAVVAGCFVGGWAAGRASRFDGIANGLLSVAWMLGAGLLAAWAAGRFGSDWDVVKTAGMPAVRSETFESWGVLGFVVTVGLMLLAAAFGGSRGEAWHRTADRVMLDVIAMPPGQRHRPIRQRRHHDGMPG